jgi:glucokinase
MTRLLAADIGGTHSRFASFDLNGPAPRMLQKTWLPTGQADSMADLLRRLAETDFDLAPDRADLAVFAVAGPVERGRYCDPPNIPWDIDAGAVEKAVHVSRLLLVNDFVAQAFACASPIFEQVRTILPGESRPGATLAVIGAGTGLGKCALITDDRGRNHAVPSEGGHTDFPFLTPEEFDYLQFAREQTGRTQIIGDLVVSGPGLSTLHHFLAGEKLEPAQVADRLPEHPATREWMARFYGRACRNYALEVMSMAGVCIAGGVAAKTPTLITDPAFEAEFRFSQTHGRLLADMPVFLNPNEDAGLWGAATFGMQHGL